jgi:putative membrane protein
MRKYLLYGAFALLVLFLLLTFGYEMGYGGAPYQYWGGMMHQGGMGMHGQMMGGYGFGGFGLLFWVLVVLFIFVLLGGRETGEVRETPIDILNRRFARGEISRDEYNQTKKEILGDSE